MLFSVAVVSAQTVSLDLTTVPTLGTPQSLVTGDFNRDGKLDLAVTETSATGAGQVEILLGNGDDTFRSLGVKAVGGTAARIVKGDFNGDGKLDLAVAVGSGGQVVVLLGNGDGTFQAPVNSGAASPSGQVSTAGIPCLAVGDINGDGKPDLVTGPYTFSASSSVAVLLGNGDGTFQSPIYGNISSRIDGPSLVVADFNGDGKADLAVGGLASLNEQIFLLPGTSSGSLTVSSVYGPYGVPNASGAIVAQDVNGDGKPDLVLMRGDQPPMVFLDGSSVPVVSNTSIRQYGTTLSLASADLNGDGHPDLIVADMVGNLFVQYGVGDGTFQPPPANAASAFYTGASTTQSTTGTVTVTQGFADFYDSVTTADFRGAGKPDVVMALAGESVILLRNGVGAAPVVGAGDVLNVASLSGVNAVPGSLMAVFGSGLAYASGGAPPSPFAVLPDTMFGMTVQLNGLDAPLLYTSPGQANIQIPWELAGQTTANFVVTRNGFSSPAIPISIAQFAPGLFAMNGQGTGQAAALINGTSSVAAPVGAFGGSRPIHAGEYLQLFGTGFGPVDHGGVETGWSTPPICCYSTQNEFPHDTTTTPLVTVGNAAATVQFSGLAPNTVGVYQINILIPLNAPVGNAIPVIVSIGGVPANAVTIAIQ